MSKLGANEVNKHYFSNTEEIYNLAKMLLTEIYSKEISDIGLDLLYNGPSSLMDIQSRLKISFESIRNYLIIMLQNNVIKKSNNSTNNSKSPSYELNTEQILNILLFPRTLNFIEKKYGTYAKMIFEQFIEFGVLTLEQIVEQIQNEKKNGIGNNSEFIKAEIIELFIKLYEENIIIYSERAIDDESYYSPIVRSTNSKINKEEIKKGKKNQKKNTEKKGKSNKNKKIDKDEIRNRNIKLNEEEDEEENEANVLDSADKGQNEKNLKNYEEFYENNTKNNMHFYINFEQIKAEFKSEIIIDYINNNISHPAAIIAGELLKKHKITAFVQGMSQILQIDYIANTYKSISFNQIEEIIKNNNEIFIKTSGDEIFLNLNKIKKDIKSKVIQNMIITKFTKEHFRVYNLLNLVGSLDQKNIMDLCLIIPKKVNSILNQLFQGGFIETNSVDVNGSNMLFYSVDEYQTTENILKMDFKIINNYKLYYNDQLNNIKNKFKGEAKQKEDSIKLTYIIDQICENILIMKYF